VAEGLLVAPPAGPQPEPEDPAGPELVPGDPREPGPGDPQDAEPATKPSGLTPPDPGPAPGDPQGAEPATRPSGLTPPDQHPGPGDPQGAEPATRPSGLTPPDPGPGPGDPQGAEPATRPSGLTPPDPDPGPEDPPGLGQPQAEDLSPEAIPPEPVAPPQEPRASRLSPAPGPCTGLRLRHGGLHQRSRSAHVAAGPPESLAVQPGSAFRVRRSLREHGGEAADRRCHLPCGHPRGRARQCERVRGQRNTHCSVNSTEIAVCHGQVT